ncbi:MAG: hypothetical protein ACLU4N_04950 [Butyricimonas faecihominis]
MHADVTLKLVNHYALVQEFYDLSSVHVPEVLSGSSKENDIWPTDEPVIEITLSALEFVWFEFSEVYNPDNQMRMGRIYSSTTDG